MLNCTFFEEAHEFSEGLAAVKAGDSWGYMDSNRNLVIEPVFTQANSFSCGYAYVLGEGPYLGYIDKSGNKAGHTPKDADGKLVTSQDSHVVMQIIDGEELILLGAFHEGFALVKNSKGLYGYIDTQMSMVITPCFHEAKSFSQGCAAVKTNDKWAFIDPEGRFLVKPLFEDVLPFSDGLAGIKTNGNWGFIDAKGQVVIEPQYHLVYPFSEGLAFVIRRTPADNSKGYYEYREYINKANKPVIQTNKVSGSPFMEGLTLFGEYSPDKAKANPEDNEDHWNFGYLNQSGKTAIPAAFDSVKAFSEGLAAVKRQGLWGYIDNRGKLVIPAMYEDAYSFQNGLALVKIRGKFAFIDRSGRWRTEQTRVLNNINLNELEIVYRLQGKDPFNALGLYFTKDIPDKKLNNAKDAYIRQMEADETVLFLYDSTLFGSAKKGFAITNKKFYICPDSIDSDSPLSAKEMLVIPFSNILGIASAGSSIYIYTLSGMYCIHYYTNAKNQNTSKLGQFLDSLVFGDYPG